jgi:cytochrome c
MRLVLALFTLTMSAAGAAQAPTAQELLDRYKCNGCHADTETKAGPAFVDVAARYAGNPQAMAIVSGFLRNGARGSGPWHMPPHPEISASEAHTMARYILSRASREQKR